MESLTTIDTLIIGEHCLGLSHSDPYKVTDHQITMSSTGRDNIGMTSDDPNRKVNPTSHKYRSYHTRSLSIDSTISNPKPSQAINTVQGGLDGEQIEVIKKKRQKRSIEKNHTAVRTESSKSTYWLLRDRSFQYAEHRVL